MSEAKFVELQNKLFQLFGRKQFEEVHSLITEIQNAFPKRLDKTSFWKACVFSIQNEPEKAIAVLNEALEKGVWWNPYTLIQDPDLNKLQDNEEFTLIIKKCENIFKENNQASQSQLFTCGNPESDTGIFSLHWRGSNAKDFAPYWFDNNMLNDFCYGLPQSSQVYGYNAFCWDDEKIATDEIVNNFKKFKENHNTTQDILAGASQGGKLSIELCLNNNVLGKKGFIAVIPAIRDVASIENLLKANPISNIKGFIITGDQDHFYNKTIELVSVFEENNLPCKLMVVEGLGHFFPSDFPKLLKEAIDFILK